MKMTRSIPQAERDLSMRVTLPAWRWRQIVYSVECHAQERESAGHAEVGDVYREAADALCAELGVAYSGGLPIGDSR